MAVACVAAVIRGWVLFDDPLAHGYDGYYYALQVRSMLAGDALFADTSAALWGMTALAAVVGDVVVSNKLAVCVFAGVAAAGGAVAARRWFHSRAAMAVTGLLWATSALHLAVSSEFVKNAAGIAVLAWLIAALADAHRHVYRMVGCVLLALGGLFVHKLTGVFGVVLLLTVVPSWLPQVRLRRVPWWAIAGTGVLAIAALAGGVLRVVDFSRFAQGLGRLGDRMQPFQDGRLVWSEQLALIGVYTAPLVLAVLAWRRRTEPDGALLRGLAVLAVFSCAPGLPFGYDLTAWRLVLMGFVAVGLTAGWAAKRLPWMGALSVAVAVVGLPSTVASRQAKEPDYGAWVAVVPVIQQHVAADESLVAHRGLCGFLWFETGRRCENFQPVGEPDGWWRVAYGFGPAQLESSGPVVPLRPAYLLVPESAWRDFAAHHDYSLIRHPLNPYRPRPDFVYGPQDEPAP